MTFPRNDKVSLLRMGISSISGTVLMILLCNTAVSISATQNLPTRCMDMQVLFSCWNNCDRVNFRNLERLTHGKLLFACMLAWTHIDYVRLTIVCTPASTHFFGKKKCRVDNKALFLQNCSRILSLLQSAFAIYSPDDCRFAERNTEKFCDSLLMKPPI